LFFCLCISGFKSPYKVVRYMRIRH